MIKRLFEYASIQRQRDVYDFTKIAKEFYATLMNEEDNSSRDTFTRRFTRRLKDYVDTDPRYQSRLDSLFDENSGPK